MNQQQKLLAGKYNIKPETKHHAYPYLYKSMVDASEYLWLGEFFRHYNSLVIGGNTKEEERKATEFVKAHREQASLLYEHLSALLQDSHNQNWP